MMDNQAERVLDGAAEVVVRLRRGDVALRAAGEQPASLSWSSESGTPPQIRRDGGVISIEQVDEFPHRRLDLTIALPASVRICRIATGHGTIAAEGLSGDVALTSGHGAIAARAGRGDLECRSGHGELRLDGFDGRAQIHTGHGDVRLEAVNGEIEATTGHGRVSVHDGVVRGRLATGHGDIALARVGGALEVTTGHGGVRASEARSLGLRAEVGSGRLAVEGGSVAGLSLRTGRGAIRLAAALEPGRYDLHAGAGNVEVALPIDARARIELHTSSGRIDSEVPLVQVGRSGPIGLGGARMVGTHGGGDPDVVLAARVGRGALTLWLDRTRVAPRESVGSVAADSPVASRESSSSGVPAGSDAADSTAESRESGSGGDSVSAEAPGTPRASDAVEPAPPWTRPLRRPTHDPTSSEPASVAPGIDDLHTAVGAPVGSEHGTPASPTDNVDGRLGASVARTSTGHAVAHPVDAGDAVPADPDVDRADAAAAPRPSAVGTMPAAHPDQVESGSTAPVSAAGAGPGSAGGQTGDRGGAAEPADPVLTILEAVARGEVSPADAERLLAAAR